MKKLSATYDPSVFDVGSLKQAKAIILTHEGIGVDVRWEKETPWVVDLAIEKLGITSASRVLDYGCGVGRIAKGLIQKTGCAVYGYDISPNMLKLSQSYVMDPHFCSITDRVLPQVNKALSIWVLQHCSDPKADIDRISRAMIPGARFLILNGEDRALPVRLDGGRDRTWVSDGIDVMDLLEDKFKTIERGRLPKELAPWPGPESTYWVVLERR